jgi:hypothetical protein
MLEELGMDTNDFNTGQTIFLLSFLAAELPSGLISKKLGPDVWIPFIITAWSVVSAAQAGLKVRLRTARHRYTLTSSSRYRTELAIWLADVYWGS